MARGGGSTKLWLTASIILLAAAIRLPGLLRAGISPDEEFTWFAVRGVLDHGLPILPSGQVYDRGLLYSVICALVALATGPSMMAFRFVSLLAGLATVGIVFRLTRWSTGSMMAAAIAATLIALSPLHAQLSTWARFYALFVPLYVLALDWSLKALAVRKAIVGGFVLAFLCRLTHELAWSVLLVPAAAWLLQSRHRIEGGSLLRMTASLFAGLTAAELILWESTASGDVVAGPGSSLWQVPVAARFVLPPVYLAALLPSWLVYSIVIIVGGIAIAFARTNRREHAASFVIVLLSAIVQFSAAAWFMLIVWLLRIIDLRRGLVVLAASIVSSIAAWTIGLHWALGTPLSREIALSVPAQGFAFASGGIYFLAANRPMALILTAVAIIVASRLPEPQAATIQRIGLVVAGWIALFGVANQSFHPRYLITFLICAWIVGSAISAGRGSAVARAFGGMLLIALLTAEDIRSVGAEWQRFSRQYGALAATTSHVSPRDIVLCDDELMARLLVGRCDRAIVLPGLSRVQVSSEQRTWLVLTGSGGSGPPAKADVDGALGFEIVSADQDSLVLARRAPIPR